ncbi:MAG TPA: phosphohistidine phosphatase SixA [Nitrososphaerales archaeon]|nr:phosphohistidine phosphatase SixA [Nitrososphaerales archaeon]
MEIYLLRHGEAGQRVPVASRDLERALTAAGKEEIEEIGEAMAEMEYEFDVIATSPVKRAKDTASLVNKALKRKSGVEEWAELSPEGDREALYRRLAKLRPGSIVMCVGHEPYLTAAISEIAGKGNGESSGFRIALKKGGMARLSVAGFSPRISGELRWLLTPKQIRKMA